MIAKFVEENATKLYSFKEVQEKLDEIKPYFRNLEKRQLRSNRPISINKFRKICCQNKMPYDIEIVGKEKIRDNNGNQKKLQMYRFIRQCSV